MKKISRILMVLLVCLAGCHSEGPSQDTDISEEYIAPVREVFIADLIDPQKEAVLKKANNDAQLNNYQFEMLFKDVYEGELHDINDRVISLKDCDDFLLETVSVDCSHCRNQLAMIDTFLELSEYPIIQYFNVGSRQEVLDLYEQEGVQIPSDLIIVTRDEGLKTYLKEELHIRSYPTIFTFHQGRVSMSAVGELAEDNFKALLEAGFIAPLQESDLLGEDGSSFLDLNRTIEDVKADLSEENLQKLEELDNDEYTLDLTFRLMGRQPDLTKASNPHSRIYRDEIDDFTRLAEDKVVVFYTILKDVTDYDKVEFINSLMEEDDGITYLVALVEGMDSSSAYLDKMPVSFNCPVVSVLGDLPDDLFNFGIIAYPTAVFIDRGTFTGAYSDIRDKNAFAEALKLFLSDECIAYTRNNQISKG